MAKFRLLEKALIAEDGNHGVVYDVGTEIGDGTPIPFTGEPGPHMEALDDEAKARLVAAEARAKADGRYWEAPGRIMNRLDIAAQQKQAIDPTIAAILAQNQQMLAAMQALVGEKRGPGRPPLDRSAA
jgi:hypothetical protein